MLADEVTSLILIFHASLTLQTRQFWNSWKFSYCCC